MFIKNNCNYFYFIFHKYKLIYKNNINNFFRLSRQQHTKKLFNKWICFCNRSKCNNLYYQKYDKITDSICYIILLYYIISINIFSNNFNNFLIFLLIFRLFGVLLFLSNNNRKFLFYFPNFYLEMTLAYSLINYYDSLINYYDLYNKKINI